MHPLLKTFSWLLFLYVAYCGLLFVFQRQILFPRSAIPQPLQSDQNIVGLEKIQLDVVRIRLMQINDSTLDITAVSVTMREMKML